MYALSNKVLFSLLRSAVRMAPAAGSSLKCEPVFDLIADKIKEVSIHGTSVIT